MDKTQLSLTIFSLYGRNCLKTINVTEVYLINTLLIPPQITNLLWRKNAFTLPYQIRAPKCSQLTKNQSDSKMNAFILSAKGTVTQADHIQELLQFLQGGTSGDFITNAQNLMVIDLRSSCLCLLPADTLGCCRTWMILNKLIY